MYNLLCSMFLMCSFYTMLLLYNMINVTVDFTFIKTDSQFAGEKLSD